MDINKREFIRALFKAVIISEGTFEPWVMVRVENYGKFYIVRKEEKVYIHRENSAGEVILTLSKDEFSSLPLKIRRALKLPPPKQSSIDAFLLSTKRK